jgi:aryl-alcohol dehydrogenase-like predicted oxidoreductase
MNTFTQKSGINGTGLELPAAAIGAFMFGTRADEAESLRIMDAAIDRG